MKAIPEREWKWFGNAAHLIVGRWCQFHMATLVGKHLISTVGEYWPERAVREIHAKVYDQKWLDDNRYRKGDDFDHAYFKRFGYEEIGHDRTFETMVFLAGKPCDDPECGCGLPEISGSELAAKGYKSRKDATNGHMEICHRCANEEKP